MNLTWTSFGKILLGAFFGTCVGWAISFFLPSGVFGLRDPVFTVQRLCLIGGALVGAAATTIATIVLDSRRPETGAAANFTMIRGTGSTFLGKRNAEEDGSYMTTEWFCIFFVPIFPVCNYRVIEVSSYTLLPFLVGSRQYVIREKHPVRWKDAVKGYLVTLIIALSIGAIALILKNGL